MQWQYYIVIIHVLKYMLGLTLIFIFNGMHGFALNLKARLLTVFHSLHYISY